VNGCESPLSSSQVVAAVAVFGNAALYYGFVYNFAPRSFEGLYLIPYTILVGICLPCYVYIELVDPIRGDEEVQIDKTKPQRYCEFCSNRKPMKITTKHCHICEKCVSHFDHHCKWLNTCIGAANYRQFFLMLICIVGMQIVHFILGIYLFTLPEVEDIAERKFGAYIAYAAVMGVSLISPLIVSGAVGSLLAFHIYIKCIGTTTFIFLKGEAAIRAKFESTRTIPIDMDTIEKKRQREREQWLKERDDRKKAKAKSLEGSESPSHEHPNTPSELVQPNHITPEMESDKIQTKSSSDGAREGGTGPKNSSVMHIKNDSINAVVALMNGTGDVNEDVAEGVTQNV